MAKHLIIFGAGASHGSDDTKLTPPLGGIDLFNALVSFNPSGWGKLTETQAQLFQDDFEKGMEAIFKTQPANMLPLQRAMAAYFFGFKPKASNLYFELAKKITDSNWDGAIATLNYEQLLTISLNAAGNKPFVGKKDEITDKDIEICIPHGSCNIFCTSVQANTTTLFSNCNVDGPIKLISKPDEFKKEIENNQIPPAMSYFTPSKDTMSGVSFIENQRKRLEELIEEAATICIVGIKTRLHDEHIWEPLLKTDANIIYCSGKTAGEEFKSWSEKFRADKNDEILFSYFDDAFQKICSSIGLS
jgi:hypothetical protein